jgi:hypothetical protein
MDIYESLQPGDLVYIVEGRKMAFCRVVKVVRDKSKPDYTEYVLDRVEQWYNHEYFETMSVFLLGKRFTVGRTRDIAYSGMWQFYSAEEFEKYYGHLPSKIENGQQIEFEIALRRITIGIATLVVLLLIIGVCYLVAKVFRFA